MEGEKLNFTDVPSVAVQSVLVKSTFDEMSSTPVSGYDWKQGIDYSKIMLSYTNSGFQATNFGLCIEEINKMISKKCEPVPEDKMNVVDLNPCGRKRDNCTIFLSYTSNLISSGVRETIRFLTQYNMVDCIVTTAGGIEEDFIKCLAPTYLGDFSLSGKSLRKSGINRIGNLLVPNNNYCKFEDWIMPILDEMLKEQQENAVKWTPSQVIARLGKEINNEQSVYYWAWKNNIPVFCPALTDGSIGDMLYFHACSRSEGLSIDIVEDIRLMNSQAVHAVNSGMIILGGGVVKHHTCNANLMRNGADFSVFVNTSAEYDGSDSGARPDEAVSWGKIRLESRPVKLYAEASLVFPLIVAETFAKHHFSTPKDVQCLCHR